MRRFHAVALLLLALVALDCVQVKAKKHSDVSAVFANAKYVYVEAQAGDIMRPGLYPEDRQAIVDVQGGLQDWNRYTLATGRKQADLVFIVRKGRETGAQAQVGVPSAPRQQGSQGPPTQSRQPGQMSNDDGMGVGAEVGPSDDILQVYSTNPDGKLIGPVWTREMKDGLAGPAVLLLQQLRAAVEKEYPSQPQGQPPAPKQP
jgi:hypothetical protein